jgi:hypothetical protein
LTELALNNPEPREIGYEAFGNGIIAAAEGDAAAALTFLTAALDALGQTHLTESVAEVADAFLRTFPELFDDVTLTLPNDVRELRVSTADAISTIRKAVESAVLH